MPSLSTEFKHELRQRSFQVFSKSSSNTVVPADSTQESEEKMNHLVASFSEHLKNSTRILALLGAGLSASSGLPTFRGAGGYWRNYNAMDLATPEAFDDNPGLVWQFYNYRRHMALKAKPNRAHLALAELTRRNPEFMTLSQNVDGLSQRAHHSRNLNLLHGSLYDVKCSNVACDYVDKDNFTDPIVPALHIDDHGGDNDENNDISNAKIPLKQVDVADLPRCPRCQDGLLRPGVVWFGESLPPQALKNADAFVNDSKGVDLMLVIGTSASVWPAAGYIHKARKNGARVAVINMDPPDAGSGGLSDRDWYFQGDAGVIVPEILKTVVGDIPEVPE